ncbi:hypothetical protein ACRZ5S_18080 [Vibrio scophthalmi]|uniref:hypothetical protein n=1 Tax=Vibrio scophthalmi TaxID=45658 RepID=UPI003EBAE14F
MINFEEAFTIDLGTSTNDIALNIEVEQKLDPRKIYALFYEHYFDSFEREDTFPTEEEDQSMIDSIAFSLEEALENGCTTMSIYLKNIV